MQVDPTPSKVASADNGSSRNLKARAIHELRRFVLIFLYLWLIFGFFVLNERIILAQRGIFVTAQGFALINALVLAKVMLVVEDLNLSRWLPPRPLIYPILHDSFLLTVLFICFHVLEKVITGFIRGASIAASVPAIGGGGFAGLVCVAVILFVALIPFFAFKHVGRALGEGQLNAMLFGRPMRETHRNRVA